MSLDLPRATLEALLAELVERVTDVARGRERPVAPPIDLSALRATLGRTDLLGPRDPLDVLAEVIDGLERGAVQVTSPRYFGPTTAAPADVSIVAEALVAAYGPQLATHEHAPFAVELEERVLAALAARLGVPGAEGTFTSGGAESNFIAVVSALAAAFPRYVERGVRALPEDPVIYASTEAHPTVGRAARMAGLGDRAVRLVSTDASGGMKPLALRRAIAADRRAGARPLMVAATAGTTSTGGFDPLPELATIATRAGAWLHVDAAHGGLAGFVPELEGLLVGIERADSVAFDPHKVLGVPLGAGVHLTRRAGSLGAAFAASAGYMPRHSARDPYARSPRWSRRFNGLPTFMVLATLGFDGVAAALRGQVALADRLRSRLGEASFVVTNDTRLPVVCFVDGASERGGGSLGPHLEKLRRAVIAADAGWLGMTRLPSGARALRAGIPNHRTTAADVDRLVSALVAAR